MASSEVVPRADDGASDERLSSPLSPAPLSTPPRQVVSARASANKGASRAALLSGQRWRRAARWLGLLIFLIGAGLLAYVFVAAFKNLQRFSDPGALQFEINKIIGDPLSQQVTAYVSVLGGEALYFLYLILLGVLGSMIAGKGIQFFAASESVIDEAVVPGYDELD